MITKKNKRRISIKREISLLLVAVLLMTAFFAFSIPANAATGATDARSKVAEKEEAYYVKLAKDYGYTVTRGKTTPNTSRKEYVIRNTFENKLVEISFIVRVDKNGKVYCTANGQRYGSRSAAEKALAKYASKKAVRTKAENEEKYFLKFAKSRGYTVKRGQTVPKTAGGEYAVKNTFENELVKISFIVRVDENERLYFTINGQRYGSRAAAEKALRKYAKK